MLYAPISLRKTSGWLLIVGLMILFVCLGLSTSNTAQASPQGTERHTSHLQAGSSSQGHHSAPNHCNTPLKSGCCACLAAEAPQAKAAALQPAFPPVPLHQNYISRLIGPAQPPPRSS